MAAGAVSPAEVAGRVVFGLLDQHDVRQSAIGPLLRLVARAVAEVDPDGERGHDETFLVPVWVHADAFDRLRRAATDLWLLEAEAGEDIDGLRRLFESLTSPAGWSPKASLDRLDVLAARRAGLLVELRRAVKRLRALPDSPDPVAPAGSLSRLCRLSSGTAHELRAVLAQVETDEADAARYRARLRTLMG